MPELSRDEDDVETFGDQERSEAVPERMEREPRRPAGKPSSPKRDPEAFADVAVVGAAAERIGENKVVCSSVAACEPVFAQAPGEWRGEGSPRASVLSRACWRRRRESCRWTRISPAWWSMSAQVRPSASPIRRPV